MTELISWTPERARVLAAVYACRIAVACSRFGLAPRPWPRSRAETAEVLADHASMTAGRPRRLRTAGGWRAISAEEWAEFFWQRRGGPLRFNEEACLVYFATFALLTRDR